MFLDELLIGFVPQGRFHKSVMATGIFSVAMDNHSLVDRISNNTGHVLPDPSLTTHDLSFAVLSRGQVGLGFNAVGVEFFGDSRGCPVLSNQLKDTFDDLFFLVVRDEQLFILTVIVTKRRVPTIPIATLAPFGDLNL